MTILLVTKFKAFYLLCLTHEPVKKGTEHCIQFLKYSTV